VTSDGGTHWHQAYLSPLDENPEGAATPKAGLQTGRGADLGLVAHLDRCEQDLWLAHDIESIRSTDAGVHWMRESTNGLNSNTTYQTVGHPTSGALYAATSSIHDMYMSYRLTDATLDSGSGAVMQSTDAGATGPRCTALATL